MDNFSNRFIQRSLILKASILVFFLSTLFSLYGQNAAELGFIQDYNFDKNVVFKTVGSTHVNMDIYYPEPSELQEENPWVLFIHGGGWAGGNKDVIFKKSFVGTLQTLLDSGVVVASVAYRLAKSPVTSYESLLDCKDAARFLIKNAEKYKLDTNEYGVFGGSAGGHLSLLTALAADSACIGAAELADIETNFKCVASFFPFTSCLHPDLRPGSIFEDEKLFVRLLGGTLEEKPKMARLLSPTVHLKQSSPPVYLLHGDNDPILPIINSAYMLEVADSVHADVKLLTVTGAGHSFKGEHIFPSFEGIADSCSKFILSHIETK